jgi:CheY-like chemotaxis protein
MDASSSVTAISLKSWRRVGSISISETCGETEGRRDGHSHPKSRDSTEARLSARADITEERRAAVLNALTHRGRRALVVDTDPVTARACRTALEAMGFIIERVDSGVAAVVAARGRVPDVILMDTQLRDVSAAEVIGWLRSSNLALASIPIVVIGTIDGSRLAVRDSRVTATLRKPLSSAAVERAVREICG